MAKKKAKVTLASFEECLARLEKIVAQLEGGELKLADALASYEEGVKHLQTCYRQLEQAERRIEVLSGLDAAGNPVTETFDEQATEDLQDKAAARSRKRSAGRRAAPSNRVDDEDRLF